jgi:hypothetical protein
MADEEDLLRKAIDRAGLPAPIVTTEDGRARAVVDGPTPLTIDAPEGWLRVVTTFEPRDLDIITRANLGLVLLETGLAHVSYDGPKGVLRIAASLPAVTDVPAREVMLATFEHLGRVRQKLLGGEGDIRLSQEPEPGDPTLADVARTMGGALSLAEDKGSFVGGLREPKSGTECALRLHTAMPGVFAADAWLMPPKRTEPDPALFERLDAHNVTLDAGALMLVPRESFVVYRWACPYRWLALDQLEAPALAYTALAAFVRWRAS